MVGKVAVFVQELLDWDGDAPNHYIPAVPVTHSPEPQHAELRAKHPVLIIYLFLFYSLFRLTPHYYMANQPRQNKNDSVSAFDGKPRGQ